MPRVLFVVHNHQGNRPGGVEVMAPQLYNGIREAGEFEVVVVTRVGPPQSTDDAPDGTRFALASKTRSDYYFYTEAREFDTVLRTARRKQLYTEDWRAFLRAVDPDVVHFRHSLWLGYDMLSETRRTLPHVPIVYGLSEFAAICNHSGQMVRTQSYELCDRSSPRRCHRCFPGIPAQSFFLRERFIKSALEHVDMFIAPSETLRQKYVDWGIPEHKLVREDSGMTIVKPLPDPPDAGSRRRIGFFGQITPFKGVDVLLEAMTILKAQDAGVQLMLHASNFDQADASLKKKLGPLLEQTAGAVRFDGLYDHDELPALMSAIDWVVVPSIWWENSPVVIKEALMFRRPVICSGIGGMAEKVTDGVNGLHFRVGDPVSLAETVASAVDSPELWAQLRLGASDPHPIDRHVDVVTGIYRDLLARRPERSRG